MTSMPARAGSNPAARAKKRQINCRVFLFHFDSQMDFFGGPTGINGAPEPSRNHVGPGSARAIFLD